MPTPSVSASGDLPPFFGEAMVALSKMRGMMTPSEYLTLIFIAERTFRFKKEVERIPIRHFLEGVFDDNRNEIISAPLGLSRRTIEGCIRSLVAKGILTVVRVETRGYDAKAKWLKINVDDKRFQAMLPVRKQDKIGGSKGSNVRQNLPTRPAKFAVQEHYDRNSSSLRSEGGEWGEEEVKAEPAKPAPIIRERSRSIEAAVAAVDHAATSRPIPLKTKAQIHAAAMRRLDQAGRKLGFDLAVFRTVKARVQVQRWLLTSARGHGGEEAARRAVEAFGWIVENWEMVAAVRLSWMDDKPKAPSPALFGSASIGSTLFDAYLHRAKLEAEHARRSSGVEIQIDGFLKKGLTREEAEVRVEANLRRAAAATTIQTKYVPRAEVKPAVEQKGAGRGFGREKLPPPRQRTGPLLTAEEVAETDKAIDWAAAMTAPAWEDQ